jgi:hypothetical protein
MMKLLSPNKIILVLLTAVALFFILSSVSFAPTKAAKKSMTDSELSSIEGQSLFSISQFSSLSTYGTGSSNVVHINLGIDVEIFGYITSSKMGYWDNGTWNGWDLDTTDYYYGETDRSSSPLIWHGIYLEFGFDNISSSTDRVLNYIEFGTQHATGKVSGVIGTITGLMSNAGTGTNQGVMLRQTASNHQVTHFTDEVLGFVFASKYRYDTYEYFSDLKGIFQKLPNHNTNIST